jgi:hypothetical protein
MMVPVLQELSHYMKAQIGLATILMFITTASNAVDPREAILGAAWWGGGLNTIGPNCQNRETCVGSVALRFEPLGRRLRVFVLVNRGRKPFQTYSARQRYPDDMKVQSYEAMWVSEDGAKLSFQNTFAWTCTLLNPERIDCSLMVPEGVSFPFTVQPLPPGPSPKDWPSL